MDPLLKLKENLHGYDVAILDIPAEKLKVIPVQRKASKPHIKRLAESMKKIGFVVPLVVIERKGQYFIIDGQHRFLAGKQAGVKSYPSILLPAKYANNLMELNVEKQMNLREKCFVALNVYREALEEEPGIAENDGRILDSIEQGYFVTVGLVYEATPRFSGSAFESLLKKVDPWTTLPLKEAVKERERRCKVLLDIHERVNKAVAAVKKVGVTGPYVYKEVVSAANPYKGKRKIDDDFDGLFTKLGNTLDDLAVDPEKMRKLKFGA